jgi:integrase
MTLILQPGEGDLIPTDTWFGTVAVIEPERLNLLGSLTDKWIKAKKSKHTRACYQRDLTAWLTRCATRGLHPLQARIADVDDWIADQRRPEDETAKPAAEASIARRVATISSWYAYLINNTAADPEPLIKHNPARTDARPRVNRDRSTTVGLDRKETDRLIDAADADSVTTSAFIRLVLFDGLRVGSAIGARIEGLGHDTGHRILSVVVKGGETDNVPIPPAVGDLIDAMLAERGNPTTGPLFVTPRGKAMYESYAFRLVRRLARQASIPSADKLSPHSLRHTAITELLEETNGNLRKAQDFAGHADPRTTRRYDRRRKKLDDHGAYALASRFSRN